LFDGFRLEVDGTWIHPAASGQRLLAFLTLLGPAVRAVVAGTLWAEVPENRALGSLRTTIWRINHAVPGLVTVERGRLAVADFVSVDVAEFIGAAAARFRGNGGTGLSSPAHSPLHSPSPELRLRELLPGWYEDWVVFERERLRQLRLHDLEAEAARLCARGEYGVALETALEAVRNEPLRESAHRAVILIHLTEGNFAEALQEYERFRKLLADQVGVEPSVELSCLVLRGSGGEEPAGSPGSRTLCRRGPCRA
jgi:DNA-binding SARP family transcriptional activator